MLHKDFMRPYSYKLYTKLLIILIYILIRYWMALSLCLSVILFVRYIETTFPLSNFKTKHIFGILTTLRKFLKPWAPPKAAVAQR